MTEKRYSATITFGGLIGGSFKAATGGVSKAMDGLKKKYKETRAELAAVNKELAKGGGNVAELTAKKAALEAQADKLKQRMASLGAVAKTDVGGAFRRLKDSVFNLRNGMLALGATAAAGFGLKTIFDVGSKADEIGDTAAMLGITARELQQLRFAADDAGVPLESVDTLLGKLTTGLAEAKDRSSAMAKSLRTVGLTYSDLAGRGLPERIKILADAFGSLSDPDAQTQFLTDLAGAKGAARLRVFFELGSAGIQKLMDEAEGAGAVMSDSIIKAGDQFDKLWRRTKSGLEGMRDILGGEILPIVNNLLTKFNEFSRQVVLPKVREWAEDIRNWWANPENQKWLFGKLEEFKNAIVSFKDSVVGAVDAIGGWGNALKVLAVVYFAGTIANVIKLGIEIAKLTRLVWALVAANVALGGSGAAAAAGGAAGAAGKAAGWGAALWPWLGRIGGAVTLPLLLGGDTRKPDQTEEQRKASVAATKAMVAASKPAATVGVLKSSGMADWGRSRWAEYFGRQIDQEKHSGWSSLWRYMSGADMESRNAGSDLMAKFGIASRLKPGSPSNDAPLSEAELARAAELLNAAREAAGKGTSTPYSELMAKPGGAQAPVNITINQQPWQSSQDLVDELLRQMGWKQRALATGALHD